MPISFESYIGGLCLIANNMKIVYCTDTISRMGGIEIVTIAKANAFAAVPGNQVWIAVSEYNHPAIVRLDNVTVIDLAVHYYEEDYKGYWHAFFDFWKKQRLHRRHLEQVLDDINPDVVITTGKDTRSRTRLPSSILRTCISITQHG